MNAAFEKSRVIGLVFFFTIAASAFAQQAPPSNDDGKISPSEALGRYEKLLEETPQPLERSFLLMKAAPTALAAGESTKAKAYALSLLELAVTPRTNSYNGDAIHVGNNVLGLLAFASNDLPEAKRLLLEAGKSKGSPVLNSFGPNMLLAKKLLAMGEKEVVVQYFELCAKFWGMGHDQLDEWKTVVLRGGIPNFGANLVYQFRPWIHEN